MIIEFSKSQRPFLFPHCIFSLDISSSPMAFNTSHIRMTQLGIRSDSFPRLWTVLLGRLCQTVSHRTRPKQHPCCPGPATALPLFLSSVQQMRQHTSVSGTGSSTSTSLLLLESLYLLQQLRLWPPSWFPCSTIDYPYYSSYLLKINKSSHANPSNCMAWQCR